MQKHTSDFIPLLIVNEETMIRNQYNRNPRPLPERNTNKSRRHKAITTESENQEVSSFPVDVYETTLNIMDKPRGQLFPSRCLWNYLKHNGQIVKD